ncbi:MAG: mechanosensitive ion channel family protein [Planctomycetia bacterium]|nr:mechanosensitive ion channel family protein [Planctomycetia bacterium]
MKHPIFSHVLTILVVAWLAALGAAGILYPERTSALFEKAMAVAAESEGGAEAGSESLLARINVAKLFENPLGNWLVFVSAVFLGILVGKICAAVLARVGRRLDARGWTARAHLANDLVGPASLALFTLGLAVGLAALEMSNPLRTFSFKTLQLLYSIAVFWYGYNLVSVVDAGLRRMTARTASKLDAQLVPLIRKTLRAVLVVIGVLFVVESVFKQDIGAWLAGLGIAGLAVSLAAQDSLKNLFGSITILLDRPFNVGEQIICGGYDGAVEEIGFRSTKVRTSDGNLVTIPNSTIVNNPVENPGRRPYIRRTMDLTITYDTSRGKIQQAVDILRAILDEEGLREPIHPTINGDEFPPRVFFKDYQADSLGLFVIYWYAPPAYWDYMEHAQRLNLRIFEEFEKAGIEFAFPTRTLYLAGDPKRKLAMEMLGKDL